MKYTNRLKGSASAIESIEVDIKCARDSIAYHMGKITKDDESNNEYHYEQIEIAHTKIQIFEHAIECIQEIDLRRFHEFHEGNPEGLILYEVDD